MILTLDAILGAVCTVLDTDPAEVVRGTVKHRTTIDARIMFAALAYKHCYGWDTRKLGKLLGKDRTTILHYLKRHNEWTATNRNGNTVDPVYAELVNNVLTLARMPDEPEA